MSKGSDPARERTLEAALVARYRQVARSPLGHFLYPVGRSSATGLGYPAHALDDAPAAVVERFVGIGNPFRSVAPRRGERVLDVGCGAGLDTFVAAERVGPSGCAVGVDRTEEMVAVAAAGRRAQGKQSPEFLVADAARLPFADGTFDFVCSNGALNLVFDKAAAFAELARVLRPGGTLSVADVLIVESVPEAVLASLDAWST